MSEDKTIPADRHAKNALESVREALADKALNSDARGHLEAAERALVRAVSKLPESDDPDLGDTNAARIPPPGGGVKPPVPR